ncbi:hypothetical protein [Streptomyces sp. Ru72]|uniref:hypothetical protein n=1 Tax=Streptomyces sp. Ru72 TaxID=2080747 RepID=UPI0021561E77|nr:hypothetical protein [Streptomyces sp. Ru72]
MALRAGLSKATLSQLEAGNPTMAHVGTASSVPGRAFPWISRWAPSPMGKWAASSWRNASVSPSRATAANRSCSTTNWCGSSLYVR